MTTYLVERGDLAIMQPQLLPGEPVTGWRVGWIVRGMGVPGEPGQPDRIPAIKFADGSFAPARGRITKAADLTCHAADIVDDIGDRTFDDYQAAAALVRP